MTTRSVTKARGELAELVNRVSYQGERVALVRHGKVTAALVSAEDLEFLEMLEDKVDLKLAHKALKERGALSWEKVKKDLGL